MKSYLTFLSRNKLYTFIEVVGLSVSLAFVVIIFCYVKQQYAVAEENPQYKDIYAVGMDGELIGLTYGIKDAVLSEVPEVELAARYSNTGPAALVHWDDQAASCMVAATDRDFFRLFPYYRFSEGSADDINDHSAAIVSEGFAQKLTPDGQAIGKAIKINKQDYVVAAVMENFEHTLFTPCDVFVNIEGYAGASQWRKNPFDSFGNVHTFIKAHEGTDRAVLDGKMNALYARKMDFYGESFFPKGLLIRLDEMFFSPLWANGVNKGNPQLIRILLAVGLLILVSAVFNYINLNVALTGKRAKEMAMRRLLGSSKPSVVMKYIAESLLFTLGCCIIGVLLAYFLAPTMNKLIRSDIAISVGLAPKYLLEYAAMVVVIGILAGLLPAVFISRFSPMDVVRGRFRLRSKMYFSKVFIMLQNVIAIVLIALTLTMQLQMRHLQNRPIGCNTKNLYFLNSAATWDRLSPLMQELGQIPDVKRVGLASCIPSGFTNLQGSEDADGNEIHYWMMRCDTTAFDMFGFGLKEHDSEPVTETVWFTETAAKAAGLTADTKDVVMNALSNHTGDIGGFGGIVGDFAVRNAVNMTDKDYAIVNIISRDDFWGGLLIETSDNHEESAQAIKKVYSDYSDKAYGTYVDPYANAYIDDIVKGSLFETNRKMRLIELFMLVAVILSLLGLVAMSAYFASERKKTIAISKVFGGTMESETRKNLRDYLLILAIANLVAIPLAVWACNKYLIDFVYRIDLSPWIFVVTLLLSFFIAIASVLWQILKVARVNPVDVLQKE